MQVAICVIDDICIQGALLLRVAYMTKRSVKK